MPAVSPADLNHLLAALPVAEFERLQPYLEPVDMPLGKVLSESGGSWPTAQGGVLRTLEQPAAPK